MTQISKQALLVENNQSFPNNNNGAITPSELRGFNIDLIDSTVNQTVYTTDSASWNAQIDALEAFTSSQQPSFTALNSFTASQLVINSGVNTYTQSANGRLTALESETANLEGFTSSINQIISNGTLLGLSTRFNLVGPGTFFSASLVQNIGGTIATLTFSSDNAKLNTSSFNDYTASTAATQSLFSASVATSISASSNSFNQFSASQNSFNLSATASIVELLNLSSSLSGGYATQGELDQSASVLQANIDTKLNTASFNSYTASTAASQSVFSASIATDFSASRAYTDSSILSLSSSISSSDAVSNTALTGRINTLSSFTASYATTGSNTFNGNQTITGTTRLVGDLTITGSVYGNVSASSITSQTASIDLSVANYFTLTLSGSTNINILNPRAGVTATLVINTDTGASASFSSNVKQPSGSLYVASPSGNIDIISFTAVNTTNVFAFPAQSFV
jgi:hypothetical protein